MRGQDDRPDALILCGGGGTRLGGVDKPLQSFAGRPLIERVIARLQPQIRHIIISANRNLLDYRRYSDRVVDDGRHAGRGPLAGFVAGLALCRIDDLLVVPGDAPALPPDLVDRLRTARGGHAAIAYVDDGVGAQPLCCLLPRRLLDDLVGYLDAGHSTPRDWYRRHATVAVDFSDTPRMAWSLNTADEWINAELQQAASSKPQDGNPQT